MNKPIYLNVRTGRGVETIDEFEKEPQQTYKEFKQYVSKMVNEYHLAGMPVYRSERCTKDWKNK